MCFAVAFSSSLVLAGEKKVKPVSDQVSGQGYGTAGCGLGSIVFGDKPGMIQILAGTTNGLFASQTFGITSGTSNCDIGEDDKKTASLFITANREALEKDISRGNGEAVAHLSQIMGCKDSGQFGVKLQQNFGSIFPSESASSDQVTDSIMQTVKEDPSLAESCDGIV